MRFSHIDRRLWLLVNVSFISLLIVGYRLGLGVIFSNPVRLSLIVGLYNLFFVISVPSVMQWGDAYTMWGVISDIALLYAIYLSLKHVYSFYYLFFVVLSVVASCLLGRKFFRFLLVAALVPGVFLSSPSTWHFIISVAVMVAVAIWGGRGREVVSVKKEENEWKLTADRLLEQLEVLKYSNRRLESRIAVSKEKLEDMEIMTRIRNILSRYEWEDAIVRVLRVLKNFNGASFVAVYAVDHLGSEASPIYYVGGISSKEILSVRKGEGLVGKVWNTEKVGFSRDPKEGEPAVCLPLKSSERFLGILCLDKWKWYPDKRMALHFLRPVADDIASFWQLQLWKKRVSYSLKEANLLYKLSILLTTHRSEKQLIEDVLNILSEEFNYDSATYFSWNAEKERLEPMILRNTNIPVNANVDRKFKIGDGIAAIALIQKKTIAVRNVTGIIGIGSIVAVPIISAGRNMGVLTVARKQKDSFDTNEVELLELAGMHLTYIIEKIRLYQLLERMAILDGLTGVYNHRYFKIRLSEELKRAERYNFPLSIVIFDIDYFKAFNDKYGHQIGDLVLKHVVKVMKDSIRDIDIVARYGGEEFVVVLPYAGKTDAISIADRVRETVWKSPVGVEDKLLSVAVSGGVATFPDDATDVDTLIKAADDRLYMAKESGRNNVKG